MTTSIKRFNVDEHLKMLVKFGVPEALAEFQARQIELAIEDAIQIAILRMSSKLYDVKREVTELLFTDKEITWQ